jgi:hypothetical protein
LLLQPTFGGFVYVGLLVFLELRKEGRESSDGSCLAFFRRVVRRRHPPQRWTRSEEREEIGRQFVSHLDRISMTKLKGNVFEMQLSELVLLDELFWSERRLELSRCTFEVSLALAARDQLKIIRTSVRERQLER